MTSPYSSNLLQKSSFDEDASRGAAPTMPRPAAYPRPTTHVVHAPQPMPMYAPQPMYPQQQPQAAPRGGGFASGVGMLALALVVVLVGAVALVGGYFATRQAAPTAEEATAETTLAMQQGYLEGRARGLGQGRSDGAAAAGTAARLRAGTERQRAWDAAYQKGLRAGERSYRRPATRSTYRGSGYRAPSYSFPRVSETTAALGAAQNLANVTGAPVDVQVFG